MRLFSLDIIGTHLDLRIETDDVSYEEVFRDIHTYFQDFEGKYSRFIEGNWLYNLNKDRQALLDEEAEYLLTFMLGLSEISDGFFDPTVGKRLTELGYGLQSEIIGVKQSDGSNLPGYQNIEVTDHKVILHGDIELEFGGIGKGFLIDKITHFLRKKSLPLPRTLVNFGGDFYAYAGWKVGLESPFQSDEVIGVYEIEDGFFACSAGTRRKWGNHHHLIDPHTGESARDVVATYIEVAGDIQNGGMIADGYATTLCVMPWEKACVFLEANPTIEGVLVRHDGTIYQSRRSKSTLFR